MPEKLFFHICGFLLYVVLQFEIILPTWESRIPSGRRFFYGYYMVTIYDIAEATGYSAPTVSKVLNGTGSLSEETRERILKKAKELIKQCKDKLTKTDEDIKKILDEDK